MTAQNDPRPASPVGGEAERFYAVKAAIERAMQDERDGKPCGSIVAAGCEAREYDDPEYAASGFIWSATEAAILAALSAPSVTGEAVSCLSDAEQKAQAARCGCRGSDDYCPCQNTPDRQTMQERARCESQPLYAAPVSAHPVEVTIFCPECSAPHIDEGEWATTRHHKTHQCQSCGHEWRPFPFATVGVAHPVSAHEGFAAAVWVKPEHLKRMLDAGDPMDGAMVWAEQRHPDFVPLAALSPTAVEERCARMEALLTTLWQSVYDDTQRSPAATISLATIQAAEAARQAIGATS